MKNRTNGEMITAYQMVERMKMSALGLKHQCLDNKASEKYKACTTSNGAPHKLMPHNNHRQNIAKWAIPTFKNHFVSILS